MRTYKFLTSDGRGVFSRFSWPRSDSGPGAWVESDIHPCRAGIHACRTIDLPYWVAPVLYEIELDGPLEEHAIKVVAPRGRLVRRVTAWNEAAREAYGKMCFTRAHELVETAGGRLDGWAPPSSIAFVESARLGFMAATIAEQLAGIEAHLAERERQSEWLVEHLALA
jgi:hypothetical protein